MNLIDINVCEVKSEYPTWNIIILDHRSGIIIRREIDLSRTPTKWVGSEIFCGEWRELDSCEALDYALSLGLFNENDKKSEI